MKFNLVVSLSMACMLGNAALAADEGTPKVSAPITFANNQCSVECVDPHPACQESARVLDILKSMYLAYGTGDWKKCGEFIDESCTTFDEASKKLIVGKAAVLEDLKEKIAEYKLGTESPIVSYVIEHPYAHVAGDQAVVSFLLLKQIGGSHPQKLESHCTDIFVKKDNTWKRIHYRTNWKVIG